MRKIIYYLLKMIHCMIKSCEISGNIPGITYHMIPFKYAKQWFPALKGTVGQIIADHIVVCSMHFTPGDFMKRKQVKTQSAVDSSSGKKITELQPIIPPPTDYVYILPDEKLKQIINGESSGFTNENLVDRINNGIFNRHIKIDPILNSKGNIQQDTTQEDEIINENRVVSTNDNFLDRINRGIFNGNKNIDLISYSNRNTQQETTQEEEIVNDNSVVFTSVFTNENFLDKVNNGIFNGNTNIDRILYLNGNNQKEITQEKETEEIINDNSVVFINDNFLDRTENDSNNENIKLDTYSNRETIEEQNRIIKDIHNYSVSPGKEEWLATRNVIRTIKKEIKCAQQKNRRLETRFVRLKKEYDELKSKKK